MGIIVGLLIIAFVIAIIVTVIYFHQHNSKLITQLTQQLDKYKQDNLEEIIDQISDTKLAGDSLTNFNENKKIYLDLVHNQLPQMQSQLINFSEKNSNFQVLSVYLGLKKLAEQIQQHYQVLEKIRKQIGQLFDHIQKNQIDLQNIQMKVEKLQTFLQQNAEFLLQAQPPLQKKLAAIIDNFPKINDLVNNGDAMKAHQMLEADQIQLSKFQTLAQQVLQRCKIVQTEFKDELKELANAEQRLQLAGIKMEDPQIATELAGITKQITQLKKSLTQLDISGFDQLKQKITERIDYLYQRIAQEWRAQKKVQKTQLVLGDFIQHAIRQNRLLQQNIRRLSEDYVISSADLDLAQSCEQKIQNISQTYQKLAKSIKQQTAIYSKTWSEFQNASRQLTEIETQQKKIEDNFDGLSQGKEIGENNLQKFSQNLLQLKHQVEVLHLPGLPDKYIKDYQMVSEETKRLEKMLSTPPINVEEITKQMFVTQEDLSNLEQNFQSLLADVQITGRLLQYANRYTDGNLAISKAANQAQNLYDQQFDYHHARQVIAQALEQVEPGAVKRISDLYYAEKAQH